MIKFEGSFSSGDAECFVLEHVEHDRPEVTVICLFSHGTFHVRPNFFSFHRS